MPFPMIGASDSPDQGDDTNSGGRPTWAPLQRKSRALHALDLLYDLAGGFDAGLGRIVAGEHAGDFQDVFPFREAPDLGDRAAVHFFLMK